MSSVAAEPRVRTAPMRGAAFISEILGPMPVGVGLATGVGAKSGGLSGAGWGLLAIFFAAVLPYILTWRIRHSGETNRAALQTRLRYLVITLACATGGLVLVASLGAPRQVVAVAVMIVCGLLLGTIVNAKWRTSNHVAGLAGAITTLTVLYSPLWLAAFPLVAVLGYARIRLGPHSVAEVVAGAALGSAVGAVVTTLFV